MGVHGNSAKNVPTRLAEVNGNLLGHGSERKHGFDGLNRGLRVAGDRLDLEAQVPAEAVLVKRLADRSEVSLAGAGGAAVRHVGDMNRRRVRQSFHEMLD